MRQQILLDGDWQFQLDPEGTFTASPETYERTATVPLPWQAVFKDLAEYSGYAWYRREFDLSEDWLGGELLVHFGAVDYLCWVYVNGQKVGEHEGGYSPFSLSIKNAAKAGKNELVVRVYDVSQSQMVTPRWPNYPESSSHAAPPFDADELPHGKQEWYEGVSGIWQSVSLIATSPRYLKMVHVTPHNSGQADFSIDLTGDLSGTGGEIVVQVANQDGASVGETRVTIVSGQSAYSASINVENPTLWEIGKAYLYTATVFLENEGQTGDNLTTRFGFREISTSQGKILLNGKPFFLIAALDQDMYQDTIYTIPSREYMADQFKKAMELGLNVVRCHIKVPDPLYYELADEMGLLVWTEIPSWRTYFHKGTHHKNQLNIDDILKGRVEQTLRDMIARDFNHPSIVIWTIINEDWGTALALRQEDRDWVTWLYNLCKQLDPTRLVVDNSACGNGWGPNIHVHTDLEDFHNYNGIPDSPAAFEELVEGLNYRPLWSYSSYGDTVRTGQEPLLLSEFGNWGLPSLKALQNEDGSDPYWFNLGPWWGGWGGEPGWPGGVQERFTRYGLDKVWKDYEDFAASSQWHQHNAMKFEIEAMRRQPNFAGYVITELADIYWESNGLLDFQRHPKVYHEKFGEVNNPNVLLLKPERYNGWAGQNIPFELEASLYGLEEIPADLQLSSEAIPSLRQTVEIPAAEVKKLGQFSLELPAVDRTKVVEFSLKLDDKAGKGVAKTSLNFLTLPAEYQKASFSGQVAVLSGRNLSENFAPALQNFGYQIGTTLGSDSQLAITSNPTPELLDWVRQGGDLLYLASSGPGPFFWVGGRGEPYTGNWISTFSWLKQGLHRRLAGAENPLGLPFKDVMPRTLIQNLPFDRAEYHQDILAGQIGGWLHHPAAHTVQLRFGNGRVLMTTFSIESAILGKSDAIATAMLHDLVDYLKSPECDPHLKANY